MPAIAQGESFCVCGVRIETGESIVMVQGRAAHIDCQHRAAQSAAADQQMDLWRQSFLFDETQIDALERAEEITGADHISFDGETVLAIDIPRLAGQISKVFELMKDGEFRTLAQIARVCNCLETSAGARLRDLRKVRFGGHQVISRQVSAHLGVSTRSSLLYEYQLVLNNGRPAAQTSEHRQAA